VSQALTPAPVVENVPIRQLFGEEKPPRATFSLHDLTFYVDVVGMSPILALVTVRAASFALTTARNAAYPYNP
jgi:hypothetical protein